MNKLLYTLLSGFFLTLAGSTFSMSLSGLTPEQKEEVYTQIKQQLPSEEAAEFDTLSDLDKEKFTISLIAQQQQKLAQLQHQEYKEAKTLSLKMQMLSGYISHCRLSENGTKEVDVIFNAKNSTDDNGSTLCSRAVETYALFAEQITPSSQELEILKAQTEVAKKQKLEALEELMAQRK